MVRQLFNKVTSTVTTALLAFTTLAAAIPVTTYAAAASDSIQKSKHHVLKQSDPVATGYGTFDFDSNSSGYTFSVDSKSDKLTKTPQSNKSSWIWKEQDEEKGGIKGLGNAYIANLAEDSSFSIWYKNVTKHGTTKKYDVKVTYDNARGAISGANGKDIAIFDGQLGAVRFRGFKHIRCTIYVYEHGTTTLISGNDNKLHFRFIDIDCNQAVESMCPGRTDWYMLGKHIKWAGESRCTQIGATQGNTVTFNGYGDEAAGKDITDNAIQLTGTSDYRHARKHTFSVGFTPTTSSDITYRVRYFAGGGAGIGTQKNGAFFSFDGGLTLPIEDDADLSIDKVSDKYVHKVGDSWDYTIKVKNVTATAITAKNVKITDSVDSRLKVNSVTTSAGTASHNGNSVTVNAGDLAQNSTVTVKVNVTALEASNGQRIYNKAKAVADNADDEWDDDGNYINSANVEIDKVVDKYEYAVGDKANFTVKVKNTKGIATNVNVADTLPSGMKLDYDSVKISGLPASVAYQVQTPADVTNQLNKTYFNKTETKTIIATKSKNGDNGWAYKINYLPANSTATITFSANATKPPMVRSRAENFIYNFKNCKGQILFFFSG